MLRGLSLRRKLAIFMSLMLGISLLFALLGTYVYLGVEEAKFDAALSPEAYDAYYNSDWEVDGLPPQPILEEISNAEVKYLDPSYENEFWVFALLSAIAVTFGSIASWFFSKLLTEPLERASASAKIIADGNFAHKMQILDDASSEIVSLGESFQYLSDSLRKMEDNVRYTSASLAHELRTPLTVIQGYIQGIQDGVFKADQAQLDLILDQVGGLSRLIDDIKLISLAEARELIVHRQRLDVAECVADAAQFMSPLFEKTRRKITFNRSEEPVWASIDPERIRQALIALINNALRYGGPQSDCSIECVKIDEYVQILITDTGPGFSEDALEHASDRFWRADRSRTRELGGTGLGLAVVKAIAESHGGSLRLKNEEGIGAQVTISLPI